MMSSDSDREYPLLADRDHTSSLTNDVSIDLVSLNRRLALVSAPDRVALALAELPAQAVMSSSFGAQAAVLLHMATQVRADLPVVFVDTTYLFPETYQFAQQLQARLKLNLHRVLPEQPWPESRLRALTADDADQITLYNQIHKVAPMQKALQELAVRTWLSGLRRQQSQSRAELPFVALTEQSEGSPRYKVYPLADWTDRDIYRYLQTYQLPYHPLWEQGYVSIGDRYLTRPAEAGMSEAQTRFFGVKRECGLHGELAKF